MFRVSQFMRLIVEAERHGEVSPVSPASRRGSASMAGTLRSPPMANRPIASGPTPPGPVVIWNLIRRCNLSCKHCYALSANHDYAGELNTDEVFKVMSDLEAARVPVLILSGGEPLLRHDLFEIAARAKSMGFYVGLSSNGTLIDAPMADRIAAAGFDYVGVSLDGLAATHDKFRRLDGAFERSLAGVRALHARGVKIGLRFTMTALNADDLPGLLGLMRAEQIEKFYFSHLNYAGRGNIHRAKDAQFAATREALDLLFDRAWQAALDERDEEFVTGNNDADGPWLLHWLHRRRPDLHARFGGALRLHLVAWGGNSSGVNVANIDNLGNVHPDTMWWHHTLGNVRERPFAAIWSDVSDPLMAGLKQKPRPVEGRCALCMHRDICGGNTRVRAQQVTGNPWAEDPGCYLGDDEIGIAEGGGRVRVTPFSGKLRKPVYVAVTTD